MKAMSNSSFRVLGVILAAADQGKTLTLREVGAALGWVKGTNWTYTCLVDLKKRGFVTWDTEDGKKLARTLRPTCRFIPVALLGAPG